MGFGTKPFGLPNNLDNFEQVPFHIKLSFSYTYKCLTMATSDCVRMRQSSKGTHIEVSILHYCESIQAALNEHLQLGLHCLSQRLLSCVFTTNSLKGLFH